jgi:hypothetical protein
MTLGLKAIFLAVALAASVSACGASNSEPPPETAATEASNQDEFALALKEHHRFHHYGGLTLFIAQGLDTLDVPEDRRAAVEIIRKDLLANLEPGRVAEQAFIMTLADGVAAGNVDAATADAAITRAQAAAQNVFDRCADNLNQLHSLLTSPERVALVDKVNAHWVVWQNVNAGETGSNPHQEGDLASLQAELGLTQDEVDRIHAVLTGHPEPAFDSKKTDTEIRGFDNAFASDQFDAKALGAADDDANNHMVVWADQHLANVLRAATPSLTSEQRSLLAERLRRHAAHNPSPGVTP